LPNIRRLSVYKKSWCALDGPHLPWALLFISPSLRSFGVTLGGSQIATVPFTIGDCVLKVLSQRCPGVEEIQLPPLCRHALCDVDERLVDRICPKDELNISYDIFAQSLRSLKRLRTTGAVVDRPALIILGSLPQLEYLSLSLAEIPSRHYSRVDLPSDAFPSLVTFEVLHPSSQKLLDSLWGLAPLVNKLTTVELDIGRPAGFAPTSKTPLCDIVGLLCANSPSIKALYFHVFFMNDQSDCESAVKLLARMRLLVLNFYVANSQFLRCLSPGLFPALQVLSLPTPSQSIDAADLGIIAASMLALSKLILHELFAITAFEPTNQIVGHSNPIEIILIEVMVDPSVDPGEARSTTERYVP
jgi:hypothetical protein